MLGWFDFVERKPDGHDAPPPESGTPVPGSVPSFLPETFDHNDYVERVKQICTTPELGGDIGGEVNATSPPRTSTPHTGRSRRDSILMRQMPAPDDDQQMWSEVEHTYDRFLTSLSDLSDARAADDSTQSEQLESDLDSRRRMSRTRWTHSTSTTARCEVQATATRVSVVIVSR